MKRKAGRPQSGPGPSISADCPWLPVRAIKLIPVLIRRDDQMIASDTRNISGNKSSLLHTAQATAVNPTSDPRQTLNSIPPCFINHQSWQLLSSESLTCICLSSGLTAGSHAPLTPGCPAAVQGQLRVSGNWWGARRGRRRLLTRGKDLNAAAARTAGSHQLVWETWWESWLAGAGLLVHRWCKVFRV